MFKQTGGAYTEHIVADKNLTIALDSNSTSQLLLDFLPVMHTTVIFSPDAALWWLTVIL